MDGESLWTRGVKTIVFLVLALVLGGVGIFACSWSFSKIHHMRQLERVPRAPISAVISGEVNLSGKVEPGAALLESPDTATKAVYYRYHVEREETDSDGDTHWTTVKDEHRSVPFKLDDKTGEVVIRPSDDVDFDIGSDSQRTSGSMRYTEYVLEPGSKIFVFGYAHRLSGASAAQYQVDFGTAGSYLPIISENSEHGERQEMALWSALALLGGLASLAFSVVFMLGVFRVHHSAFYLVSVTSVMIGVLVFQGVSMMRADLDDAATRAERALTEGKDVIAQRLKAAHIKWDGEWKSLGSFGDKEYKALSPKERSRLARVRLGLAQSVERTNENLARFPESMLGPLWGIEQVAPLPLPPADQKRLAALEAHQEPTRVSFLAALIGLIVGGLGTLLGSWLGLKKISTKRTIENVPTSPIDGVAYGLCEIKGTADLAEDEPVLVAPLTERECIYYHYVVERKDSDGDWSTVQNEERSVSFLCRDNSGRISIDHTGARFMAKDVHTSHSGNTRHTERRIAPGEDIYVLASAGIDPETHDKLQLGQGHGDLPFIVSSFSEQTVMYKEARSSFYLFNVGLIAAILAALGFAGMLGSFGPMLYTTAAAFSGAFLFVMLFFLYYNDLIFLRERVERNWSNIDVALKKRFDLISALENTVKGYLAHESELQEALAHARSIRQGAGNAANPEALAAEEHVRSRIIATVEAYPDLRGQQLVDDLMQSLTDVENEIALMRDGFNDAVERFNTRQLKVPELFIAKMFGFKKASHFRTFGAEREAPGVAGSL